MRFFPSILPDLPCFHGFSMSFSSILFARPDHLMIYTNWKFNPLWFCRCWQSDNSGIGPQNCNKNRVADQTSCSLFSHTNVAWMQYVLQPLCKKFCTFR
jgi:hypothetical protein